jgi:hypothetical protein
MSTTDDGQFELIEVPVSHKIEVNITLDELLGALAQQAGQLSTEAANASPQVADRLKQLGQLASDIHGQMGQFGQRSLRGDGG